MCGLPSILSLQMHVYDDEESINWNYRNVTKVKGVGQQYYCPRCKSLSIESMKRMLFGRVRNEIGMNEEDDDPFDILKRMNKTPL